MRSDAAGRTLAGLVAACAQETPTELSTRQALERVEAGSITLIDVRKPEEWTETGRAPGAIGITLQDEDFLEQVAAATGGDREAPVAFICRSGNRSEQASDRLLETGYTNVFNVAGGMKDWTERSLPVEAWSAPQD